MKYNGMATMNGVIFESDGVFVKAIQKSDGVYLKGRTLPTFSGFWPKVKKIPVLRTLAFMVDAFVFRPLYLFDWAYLLMMVFVLAIPYGLEQLIVLAQQYNLLTSAGVSMVENMMGFIIFGLVILFFRITGIASYHAAEHKTGNYYDAMDDAAADADFSRDVVETYSRIHPRCGTNLLVPVMVVMLLVGYFITSFWQTLLVLAVAIELISIAARHRDRKWARWILTPGLYLQRLTTKECTAKELGVGIAALSALVEMHEGHMARLDRKLERSS